LIASAAEVFVKEVSEPLGLVAVDGLFFA